VARAPDQPRIDSALTRPPRWPSGQRTRRCWGPPGTSSGPIIPLPPRSSTLLSGRSEDLDLVVENDVTPPPPGAEPIPALIPPSPPGWAIAYQGLLGYLWVVGALDTALDLGKRDLERGTSLAHEAQRTVGERAANFPPPLLGYRIGKPRWRGQARSPAGGPKALVRAAGRLEGDMRRPTRVISSYARAGTIDHRPGEFSSVLRFIEENWGTAGLSARDRAASDLSYDFAFSQHVLRPDPLPLVPGVTW
jgi:Phosphoesterase family